MSVTAPCKPYCRGDGAGTGGATAAGAGGPFGSLQVPFMGSSRLQSATAAWGMAAPPAPVNTSPINGLLTLRGSLSGSATAPEVRQALLTVKFGSIAKVLAKCMLEYYRISECYWAAELSLLAMSCRFQSVACTSKSLSTSMGDHPPPPPSLLKA